MTQNVACEVAARLLLPRQPDGGDVDDFGRGGDEKPEGNSERDGERRRDVYTGYVKHGSHCSECVQDRVGNVISMADAAAAAALTGDGNGLSGVLTDMKVAAQEGWPPTLKKFAGGSAELV